MRSASQRLKVKSAVLCGLIALNALLVAVLIARHTPEKQAQAAGRPIGDVIAIPGTLSGFVDGVVFLYDPQGQRLSVISCPTAGVGRTSEVLSMRPMDLAPLLNAAGGAKGK
jgi:hypothetical protein